jgi:predicted secreted protein
VEPFPQGFADMSLSRLNLLITKVLVIAALALAGTAHVAAQPAPEPYDRVDLTASAELDVDNDLLVAVVFAEVQDERQAAAASQVNDAIRWASREAERVRAVRSQTLQYTSFPVYTNRRIVGWRARQSLRLESNDAEALSELLGVLQERVAIQSVNYDVSKEARDAAEEGLIADALAQFDRRAKLVASELGRSGYRIVRISVGTGGFAPAPVPYFRAEEQALAAAPALDAGVQTVNVSVSGTIELDPIR